MNQNNYAKICIRIIMLKYVSIYMTSDKTNARN